LDIKWIEDLLALAEARTLTEAAELRNITQPAFTRRIQQIERALAMTILDRTHRPAQVTSAIRQRIDELRRLAGETKRLTAELRRGGNRHERVSITAQHTLSIGLLAPFIARLTRQSPRLTIRLRSANRSDCYSLLMNRQAQIMVAYDTERLRLGPDEALLDVRAIGEDRLTPVAAPAVLARLDSSRKKPTQVPIVLCPKDTFLGDVFEQEVLPALSEDLSLRVVSETALAPAALAMAMAGAGLAWLPRDLCSRHIQSGDLVELQHGFPSAKLRIVCARRRDLARGANELAVWQELQTAGKAR
jgi:DNA-binding transcriptional LysR family regulator